MNYYKLDREKAQEELQDMIKFDFCKFSLKQLVVKIRTENLKPKMKNYIF